jgi:aspartate-semialdehyde dehydrogenase
MATSGLFRERIVEWVTTMTYQAASGAAKMLELVKQMQLITSQDRVSASESALEVDRSVTKARRDPALPASELGAPLAASLLPWIDRAMPRGQTREEWKGMAQANKIMGLEPPDPIDGICFRVGSMRCHSQGPCIKLTRNVPEREIEQIIAVGNPWVRVVPNGPEATCAALRQQRSPARCRCHRPAAQAKTRPRVPRGVYRGGSVALRRGGPIATNAADPSRTPRNVTGTPKLRRSSRAPFRRQLRPN